MDACLSVNGLKEKKEVITISLDIVSFVVEVRIILIRSDTVGGLVGTGNS